MILHENAYNFVSSLEDDFATPNMPRVNFYMPVSQRYNHLDCVDGQKADIRGKRGPAARPVH